ncbi:D-glycero-beta-D-manno-heptose 1-phosphate adenylyltransferase [Candidatus Kapabacteria bacterium]|nr:D-glycero-beta-D-manno-heptose 1-phosphate adenylyltransferase [Candidatus Kapabacteria bacterium]
MIIEDWSKLKIALEKEKLQNKKIVFTNGCFDIIHPGHVQYLYDSKSLGAILVVALNTDSSVRKLKGETRPINNQTDRLIVMDALKPVDYVTLFDEDTPLEIIKTINPDIITKGGDYTPESVVGADHVLSNGGKVEIIKFVPNKSTTNIINKMA